MHTFTTFPADENKCKKYPAILYLQRGLQVKKNNGKSLLKFLKLTVKFFVKSTKLTLCLFGCRLINFRKNKLQVNVEEDWK